jgi:L-cysteine:1D-myo-inositol 2-amino-2-deoxy-alpha-D-glucopyranoside ligase
MRLYSSLSGTVEPFTPGDDVRIYVCGITPYDTTHLGHAFTYTVNDILIRYLEYSGHTVIYVQNVTDIDDDILRRARESGEDWLELGNRWTVHFIQDMITLNVRPPDHYPRATEFITEIIAINQRLLDKGLAYERDGNLYYHVNAWSEFGKLSKLEREEMLPIANDRGNVPDDPHKQDPLDFVLWQAQKPGEPGWKSPWGAGRPGWHIECSAMASRLLGPTIDIHSGGGDLIFPHHECEIAQLEPVTGQQPFVRFWLHAAMVYHEGEKMSKSLGNLIMCRDLLRSISPDTLRIYLGMHHYRQPWSFDEDELREAGELAELLQEASSEPGGEGARFNPRAWETSFRSAMENDLDTPAALQALVGMASEMLAAGRSGQDLRHAKEALQAMTGVFGLRLDAFAPEARVIAGWETHLKKFTN